MTTADPAGEPRARVISCLVASVPGLDIAAAQRALAAARADRGRALREVDALLNEHPAALATTPVAYPLALVRLAHALTEAGYQTIAVPACAGCGKITTDLRRTIASGRVCGSCAARASTGNVRPVRPGQADQCPAPRGRDLLGLLRQGRAGRDRMRRVRPEAPGSRPDARRQRPLPVLRDAPGADLLGLQRTVAGTTGAGPVCASCYQAPQRPCPEDRQAGDGNRPGLVL